jgi:putative ABC transport system permease protein
MNTYALALRNLLRNRRRSLTTLLAIVLGANAMMLFEGFARNIKYTLQTSFVQRSGHLQVQHRDYFLFGSGNPGAYAVADHARLVSVLRADPVLAPMLAMVTPTLQLGGIAGNFGAGVSRTVLGTGLVVDEQNQMRHWNDFQLTWTPRLINLSNTPPDSAIIGLGVARVLQLCGALKVDNCPRAVPLAGTKSVADAPALPDDITSLPEAAARPVADVGSDTRIELLASSPSGAPNVSSLNVVEARTQGVKELDDVYVAMHLEQAQRLVYGREPPKVTAVAVQLRHTDQLPAAKARLTEILATQFKDQPLDTQEFTTLNPQYGQTVTMFGAIFGFVAILIGAIVLFMVGNTMSMAVVERTVEIGTLRAMGLRQRGIRQLFIAEGVLLGLIGSVLGALSALAIAAAVNVSGLTWTPPGQANPIALAIRVWGEPRMVLVCSLGLMLVVMASALWPARRAARLNIVEALRHV